MSVVHSNYLYLLFPPAASFSLSIHNRLISMSAFNNMCQQQQQRRWRIASRIVLFFSSYYIWIILLAFPSRWTKIAAVKSLQVLLPLSSSRQIIAASVAKSKSKSTFRLDAVGTFSSTTIKQEITTRYNNETTSSVTASSSSSSYFPSSLPSSSTATTAVTAAALDTSIALPDLYEEEIRQYLRASSSASSAASSLDQFHIHGWRWHTKSLVRDAGRLHKLASKTMTNKDNNSKIRQLKDASDYVIGFNLIGLHKIETSLFFPWMRDKLTTTALVPSSYNNNNKGRERQSELSSAFSYIMDKLENDRRTVDHLGTIITRNANIVASSSNNNNNHKRLHAMEEIVNRSAELQTVAQRMMETEDQLLVPAIALLVPEREQKSFNQKVLLKLGLLDSRLHLVGMYETLLLDHNDNDKEKELFHKAIPALSRKMIPRWKRKLYEPKTYMLE